MKLKIYKTKKLIFCLGALTSSAAMFAQSNDIDVYQTGDQNSFVVTQTNGMIAN